MATVAPRGTFARALRHLIQASTLYSPFTLSASPRCTDRNVQTHCRKGWTDLERSSPLAKSIMDRIKGWTWRGAFVDTGQPTIRSVRIASTTRFKRGASGA
jgi:hypothetical protein